MSQQSNAGPTEPNIGHPGVGKPGDLGDSALILADKLCRIASYWQPPSADAQKVHNETEVGAFIASRLAAHPWLKVFTEFVRPGRPNVIAFDCEPWEVELFIVGHIDTVRPVPGWTATPYSVKDGRYYALGAADAKAAIGACLDAIERVGPTKGVGYLFYCDEEYNFIGMQHFVDEHAEVRPRHVLSLCGAPARMQAGCRGIIECELHLAGHAGHASRPWTGRSASEALIFVLEKLGVWTKAAREPLPTVLNIAAIHAGTGLSSSTVGGSPKIDYCANRIPDSAWALLELRCGGPGIDARTVRECIDDALGEFNALGEKHVTVRSFSTHFELPGFNSTPSELACFETAYNDLHSGEYADPGATGYLDVALLVDRHDSAAVCLGPRKGNEHAPDEWVDVQSLLSYRDGTIKLLSKYERR